ncbi:MAG: PilZ domain-containing protein [Beijerinckiaceae bacterium]|nr:PilZ domain-containing protein [Beijerinckiaceae bacterium]
MARSSLNKPCRPTVKTLDAVKITPKETSPAPENGFYYVVRTAPQDDKRAFRRRRTRLRTGKILSADSLYLIDCQIFDCSETGARLRLFENWPVPFKFRLFDESAERIGDARVVWQKDRQIGIEFAPFARPRELTKAQLSRLRSGYRPAEH